jgi:hypothetical protein
VVATDFGTCAPTPHHRGRGSSGSMSGWGSLGTFGRNKRHGLTLRADQYRSSPDVSFVPKAAAAIALHFGQNDSLDERVEGRRSPHPALLQSVFETIAEVPARLRIISGSERGG